MVVAVPNSCPATLLGALQLASHSLVMAIWIGNTELHHTMTCAVLQHSRTVPHSNKSNTLQVHHSVLHSRLTAIPAIKAAVCRSALLSFWQSNLSTLKTD